MAPSLYVCSWCSRKIFCQITLFTFTHNVNLGGNKLHYDVEYLNRRLQYMKICLPLTNIQCTTGTISCFMVEYYQNSKDGSNGPNFFSARIKSFRFSDSSIMVAWFASKRFPLGKLNCFFLIYFAKIYVVHSYLERRRTILQLWTSFLIYKTGFSMARYLGTCFFSFA